MCDGVVSYRKSIDHLTDVKVETIRYCVYPIERAEAGKFCLNAKWLEGKEMIPTGTKQQTNSDISQTANAVKYLRVPTDVISSFNFLKICAMVRFSCP